MFSVFVIPAKAGIQYLNDFMVAGHCLPTFPVFAA